MAVYQLDATNRSTLFDSFIAALQSAGVYGQTLQRTSSDLFFTLAASRSVFYYRLNYNSDTEKRPSLYYGTGYSNGALVDQRTALIITSDLYGSHWCIVGAVTVAYLAKSAQSTQCAWFITKADDVSNTEIIGAVRTSSGTSNIYWTNGHVTAYIASLSILGVSAGLLTSDGQYYLRAKPVVVSSTGALLSTSLSDLWILCRPASFVGGIEIYGDDVVLCSGSVTNPAAYNVQPLYVVGGNI